MGEIELGPVGEQVAENVRVLRQVRKLSCERLSTQLQEQGRYIPKLGLQRLERRERRVDVDDLTALAKVFGIQPGDLLRKLDHLCKTCWDSPPARMTCQDCGKSS